MAGSNNRALFLQVGGNIDQLAVAMRAGKSVVSEFGTAANDTVAEIEAAFAKLGGGSFEQSARGMQSAYLGAFRNIQANAQAAANAPSGTSAISILNAGAAQQSADAATKQAAALRIVADAAARAASATTDDAAASRIYATAAEAAAIGAEQQAVALRAQAGVLAGIASELRSAGVAEDGLSVAHSRVGASGLIADHVVRSFSDSIAAGQSPVRALTIEMGRIVEGLQLFAIQSEATEGAFGKFVGFLGGPWGIAVTLAISLGAALAGSLFESADAAEKTTKAHNALKDAVDRLNDSQAKLNHTTRQGIQDDLDAAEASRTREVQVRKLIDAELVAAKSKLDAARRTQSVPGGTVPGAAGYLDDANAQSDIAALEGARRENDRKTKEAETAKLNASGRLIARDVEAANDPKTAVSQRYDDTTDKLQRAYEAGKIDGNQYRKGLLDAANARDVAEEALKPNRQRRPKVDHTAEREANKDRAYEAAVDQVNERISRANLALADTAEARYAVEIAQLDASKKHRDTEIQDQVTAKKLTQPQADLLIAKTAEATTAEEAVAKRKLDDAVLDRQLAIDKATLDGQISVLTLQGDLATTLTERRRIAREILDKEQQEARETLQDKIAKEEDPKLKASYTDQLTALPATYALKQQQSDRQNADPLQSYMLRLHKNTDDMNEALKGVKADGLQSLEDGLTGILDGTESVASAFKKMADAIIADLVRIAVEKLIVKVIGGGIFADGIVPGHADGIIPGFAAGIVDGIIQGPGNGRSDSILAFMGDAPIRVSNGESIMTEAATRRYGRALKAMNDNTLPGFATGLVPDASIRYPAWPDAQLMQRSGAAPQVIYVAVDKSELFDVHVQRAAAPLAQAAVVGGSQMAQSDLAKHQSQIIPT